MFFCGKSSGSVGLHEAATFQIDGRVRACALLLEDTELLAKLSPGNMVALYHTEMLSGFVQSCKKSEG